MPKKENQSQKPSQTKFTCHNPIKVEVKHEIVKTPYIWVLKVSKYSKMKYSINYKSFRTDWKGRHRVPKLEGGNHSET